MNFSSFRKHSLYPKHYWSDSLKSLKIFSPTFGSSIEYKKDSLLGVTDRVDEVKILLLNPESMSFSIHASCTQHLNMHDLKYLIKKYKNLHYQLNILLDQKGGELRYYDVYPTVSFIIVDNLRIKVDYVLPKIEAELRPVVEYGNAILENSILNRFNDFFNKIWNEAKSVES